MTQQEAQMACAFLLNDDTKSAAARPPAADDRAESPLFGILLPDCTTKGATVDLPRPTMKGAREVEPRPSIFIAGGPENGAGGLVPKFRREGSSNGGWPADIEGRQALAPVGEHRHSRDHR
jgi:hypothetical protein